MTDEGTVPARRDERLIVERIGDEALVFDRDTDEVHHFPAEVTRVWDAVGADERVTDVAQRAQLSEDATLGVLEQLAGRGLLNGAVSRRGLLRGGAAVGAGAVVIPAITTLLAPTAASAMCIPGHPGPMVDGAGDPGYDVYTAIGNAITAGPSGNAIGQFTFFSGNGTDTAYGTLAAMNWAAGPTRFGSANTNIKQSGTTGVVSISGNAGDLVLVTFTVPAGVGVGTGVSPSAASTIASTSASFSLYKGGTGAAPAATTQIIGDTLLTAVALNLRTLVTASPAATIVLTTAQKAVPASAGDAFTVACKFASNGVVSLDLDWQ